MYNGQHYKTPEWTNAKIDRDNLLYVHIYSVYEYMMMDKGRVC